MKITQLTANATIAASSAGTARFSPARLARRGATGARTISGQSNNACDSFEKITRRKREVGRPQHQAHEREFWFNSRWAKEKIVQTGWEIPERNTEIAVTIVTKQVSRAELKRILEARVIVCHQDHTADRQRHEIGDQLAPGAFSRERDKQKEARRGRQTEMRTASDCKPKRQTGKRRPNDGPPPAVERSKSTEETRG